MKTIADPNCEVSVVVTVAGVLVQPVAVAVKFAASDWPFGTLSTGGLRLNSVAESLIVEGASQNSPVRLKVLPFSEGSSFPFDGTVVLISSDPVDDPSEQLDATRPVTGNELGGAACTNEVAPVHAAAATRQIEIFRIICMPLRNVRSYVAGVSVSVIEPA